IVSDRDVQSAAARTGARFVVTPKAVWEVSSGVSAPHASAPDRARRAVAIAEAIAARAGTEVNASARASFLELWPASDAALDAWAEARVANRQRRSAEAEEAARRALRAAPDFALAQAELAIAMAPRDPAAALAAANDAATAAPAA